MRRRTVLRAWAETRGWLGGHSAAHRTVRLSTRDGLRLDATLLPGPGAVTDHPAAALFHGFGARRSKPSYGWLADELATRMTVLAVDLRGHGTSAGRSGLGSHEHHDVAAAVEHLRALGHSWVAAIGVSMGATATANAIDHDVALDATVLVSGPARIELIPTTRPMQQLRRVWHAPAGRAALRAVTGVRVVPHTTWDPPPDPAVAIKQADGPVLVVHGADDHFFPVEQAEEMAAATPRATLWREPVFGHAEDGFVDPFGRRLGDALLAAHRTGEFPAREASRWLS